MSAIDCKAIGKVLSEFKQIRELNLSDCGLRTDIAKEIADGLMRAKQLEIIRLSNNSNLDVSQMVYNLAFSPKIKLIDASSTGAGKASVVENFQKLLEISGSITTIILKNTQFI